MKKLIKRLMLAVALLLALAALFAAGGYTLLRGTPDYYDPKRFIMTAAQRLAATESAEQTLARIHNLAADAHSADIRAARGTTAATTSPTTAPAADANTFSFTEPQLNALLDKWSELKAWKERYQQYVQDPVIILRPGTIILAGKVNKDGWDTVLSLHFEPQMVPADDASAGAGAGPSTTGATGVAKLDLNLTSVLAGRLPVPQESILSPVRDRIVAATAPRLPTWQQQARVEPTGSMNDAAVNAALTKQGVHILNNRPIEPVLFIPVGGSNARRVPVRLTSLTVNDGSLSMTVVPLTPQERTALLQRIREPLNVQTAMSASPSQSNR
jgi:hypothetical protein